METNACGIHTSLVNNVLRDETEGEEIKNFSCFYSNQLLLSFCFNWFSQHFPIAFYPVHFPEIQLSISLLHPAPSPD